MTPGSYALSITGTSGSLSRATTVTLVIQRAVEADFELSVVPTSQAATPPQSTSYVVSVSKKGDFKSTIGLVVSGAPSGVQGTFNPSSGTPDYTSTLTVTTIETAQPGTYVLTIYASGGGKTKSTTVTLITQAATSPSPTGTTTQPPSQSIDALLRWITEQPYLVIIVILLLVILALAARGRRQKTQAER